MWLQNDSRKENVVPLEEYEKVVRQLEVGSKYFLLYESFSSSFLHVKHLYPFPHDDTGFKLQDEQLEHIKTKAKLASESEKLEFALGEIEILTKQLNREKMAFEKS